MKAPKLFKRGSKMEEFSVLSWTVSVQEYAKHHMTLAKLDFK